MSTQADPRDERIAELEEENAILRSEVRRLQRVRDRLQVGRWRFAVDAGSFQAALIVLTDVLAGGAEHLQVAEAAHVELAPHAERLADRRQLVAAGDAAPQDVDAAHVGGAA